MASASVQSLDVCGWKVLDREGAELGEVDDVIVDLSREAEYLLVTTGTPADEDLLVIPFGAVVRVTERSLHLDRSRDRVAPPRYHPRMPEDQYLEQVSEYYGRTAS